MSVPTICLLAALKIATGGDPAPWVELLEAAIDRALSLSPN
jgi:hypothetical protein